MGYIKWFIQPQKDISGNTELAFIASERTKSNETLLEESDQLT